MSANRRTATALSVAARASWSPGYRPRRSGGRSRETHRLRRPGRGRRRLSLDQHAARAGCDVAGAADAPRRPPSGTTGVFTNIFYWLDKDDDLVPHVGHQVKIEGDLKGELRDGQIKIDRKDQWTEIEVESDGRDMKARVPNASVVAGPNADRKMAVLVRRVDVNKVRMLDATCR